MAAPDRAVLACPAVLAVDLQNDGRRDGDWPVAGFERILDNAARVIEAARRAGVPVAHLQDWRAAGPREWIPEGAGATADTWGAQLCAEVAPRPGEPVIRKAHASGFKATGLAGLLAELRVGSLIVMGVWSDMCVRATVIDATELGFRVWLVKDACGSGTETMHRSAVLDMANRLYGGAVADAAETAKALRGEAHRAWSCTRPVAFRYTLETLDRDYERL